MKRLSIALFAFSLALPFLAIGEPTKPVVDEELFTPADVELGQLGDGKSQEAPEPLMSEETQAVEQATCTICKCKQLSTGPVTRVGSTCSNARQNAAAAARALAVCDSSFEGPCGPVTHSIGTCSPNPAGAGYQATATATYYCEYCFEREC